MDDQTWTIVASLAASLSTGASAVVVSLWRAHVKATRERVDGLLGDIAILRNERDLAHTQLVSVQERWREESVKATREIRDYIAEHTRAMNRIADNFELLNPPPRPGRRIG